MEEELERNMTPRLIKDLGLRYPTEKSRQKYKFGVYECAYWGKEWETTSHSINNSPTKSCGCQIGRRFKHGLESNKFYGAWRGMMARCNTPKDKGYKNYGARGITVCEEWLDIKNFVVWAERTHPNISGVSLDRIDNDKGYSPENCRWADRVTQNINQRMKKSNTSGFVGVCWDIIKNKWTAKVGSNNKLNYLEGTLTTEGYTAHEPIQTKGYTANQNSNQNSTEAPPSLQSIYSAIYTPITNTPSTFNRL